MGQAMIRVPCRPCCRAGSGNDRRARCSSRSLVINSAAARAASRRGTSSRMSLRTNLLQAKAGATRVVLPAPAAPPATRAARRAGQREARQDIAIASGSSLPAAVPEPCAFGQSFAAPARDARIFGQPFGIVTGRGGENGDANSRRYSEILVSHWTAMGSRRPGSSTIR